MQYFFSFGRMFRPRRDASTRPLIGFLICLAVLVVFECLLAGLAHVMQQQFAADRLDARLAIYVAPAFGEARIWFGVVVIFFLLVQPYFDLGRPGPEAYMVFTALVSFACVLVVIRALQFPFCIDDAYIDFRQARNLVLQGSLDYNVGDPVMGFTSHLHLWILVLLGWLGGFDALPRWSQNFNILCDLLSFGLVYQLGRQLKLSRLAALAGSVWLALSIYLYNSAAEGKESSLVMLLLLILIYAIETNWLTGVAWAAVLIFLARPEGVLVAAVAGGWALYVHGWRSLKYWILPGVVAGFWYVLLLGHFGTIWPQGMVAKALTYPHKSYGEVLNIILWFLADIFGCNNGFRQSMTTEGWVGMAIIIPLLIWVLGRSRGTRVYLVAVVLISLALIVKKVELISFPWYFAWYGMLPILVVPALLDRVLGWIRQTGALRIWLMAVVMALVASLPLLDYPIMQSHISEAVYPCPLFIWNDLRHRLLTYRDLAQRLKAITGGAPTVAVCEDGIFGYTYGGPLLTLDGLAFRDITRYYPMPGMELSPTFLISPQMIHDQKPDLVVFLEVFGRNHLLKSKDFRQQYVLREILPETVFTSSGLFVFQRKSDADAPAAPAAK